MLNLYSVLTYTCPMMLAGHSFRLTALHILPTLLPPTLLEKKVSLVHRDSLDPSSLNNF